MMSIVALFVVLAAATTAAAQTLPGIAPAPPGVYYNREGIPKSLMVTPVFPRCPNATFDCQPFTSPDIPVTYKMQTTSNHPEQFQVVPADISGKYYAVTFTVPRMVMGSTMAGNLSWRNKGGASTNVPCKSHRYQIYPKSSPSYYKSGFIYFCYIGPITTTHTIFYKVTAPTTSKSLYHFKPYPFPGDITPFKMALIADLGQTLNSSTTLDNLKAGKPDVTLFAGDLNYADNYGPYPSNNPCSHFNGSNQGNAGDQDYSDEILTCGEGGLRWDSWGRLVEKVFAYYPVTYVAGNHELESEPSLGQNTPFIAYTNRIPPHVASAPSSTPPELSPRYYSLNIGLVHVLGISTFDTNAHYTNQYKFVTNDLDSVNKSVTPWLVVFQHSPWYNTDRSHYLENEQGRVAFERFLYAAGTDLVHSGHVHAYERSIPVYNFNPDPCGPVHVTVGDAGNDEGVAGPFLLDPTTGQAPYYSAFRDYYFGHSEIVFHNASTASYTWLRNIDGGRVADEFTLTSKLAMGCPKM